MNLSSSFPIASRLFLTCWVIYGLHFATNTVREIYPALSLGDHLSFDVSAYAGLHSDIFEIAGRGTYINNNPGASILAAVPYTLFRPAIDFIVRRVEESRARSGAEPPRYETIYPLAQEFYRESYRRGLDVKFGLAAGVIQIFLMAPLSALSAVLMFFILASLTGSRKAALLLALLYAFATPIFYRTATLSHNLLVSHCAFLAFALLWRPWDRSEKQGRPRFLWAGILTGWVLVLDYSGVVVVAFLSLYALIRWTRLPEGRRRSGDLVRFGCGLLAAVSVLAAYQWSSFGSPFYPAQHYMPPTQYSHFGYQGIDFPHLDLLWETAFGMRFGLFTSAPLLLVVFYVPAWFQRIRLTGSLETWFILSFSSAFFLFCAMNQFGRLQFNSGVRYIVPVTPFLFLIASGVLLRIPALAAAWIGVAGTYWSWCLAMYRDVEQGWGIFDSLFHVTLEGFRLPWLTTLEKMGYVSPPVSLLPILVLTSIFLWVLWNTRSAPLQQPARPATFFAEMPELPATQPPAEGRTVSKTTGIETNIHQPH